MDYWLFKSEPGVWSWDDQVKEGPSEWDGVRNHQANNNMKAMKIGDRGFFYHSVNEKQIVGIVEVVRELTSSDAVETAAIAGIGISGQQHGSVFVDDDDCVIRPAKLWCDTSPADEAR